MKKLEFWGENFEKNGNFLDRKISLCEGKTLLKGGTKVGKTTLAKQFLSRFDAPFYFNFNDIRNEGVSLKRQSSLSNSQNLTPFVLTAWQAWRKMSRFCNNCLAKT